jgi:hypothetical protein
MSRHPSVAIARPESLLELADAFIRQFHGGAGGQEREQVRSIIVRVGEHVARATGPGAWASFDARAFLRRMPHADEHGRTLTRIVLVGFFGFLAFRELITPAEAQAIVVAVRTEGPREPMLDELCRATTAVLMEGYGG